ncbi:MAG: hypothetical protein LBL87_04610 [Ruminococcus sp.]|jgi:hypothetical protein|nr:hypothetical protein [Ruminococcus sp.]
MSEFDIKLIIVIAGGGLLLMVGLFLYFRHKTVLWTAELQKAVNGCLQFQAIVQSIDDDGNPVLLFRDERKKATVVHKYKSAGMKKYKTGETEVLCYSDERDFSLIPDDNPIYKKMFVFTRAAICGVMAVPIIIMICLLVLIIN